MFINGHNSNLPLWCSVSYLVLCSGFWGVCSMQLEECFILVSCYRAPWLFAHSAPSATVSLYGENSLTNIIWQKQNNVSKHDVWNNLCKHLTVYKQSRYITVKLCACQPKHLTHCFAFSLKWGSSVVPAYNPPPRLCSPCLQKQSPRVNSCWLPGIQHDTRH